MRVVVAGAGIIGYAVAYELASRGAEVILLDPAGAGQGATLASAGILAPYIEGHSAGLLRLGLGSLQQYDPFLARVRADSGRAVEHRLCGTLQIARTVPEAETLEREARRLAALGASCRLLDGGAVRALEPGLAADVSAGLLVADHGYVGVAMLIAALSDAVAQRGGALRALRAEAVEVNGGVRVRTGDGAIECDAVVLAAGSWSGGIPTTAPVAAPVRPVRGQLVHLRFPAPPLARIVWGSGAYGGWYLIPWEDGSVLAGATVEEAGFDARVTTAGVRQILDGAAAMLPAAAEATFVAARVGLRPSTPDELPIIGRSSTMRGVYYATGHYRNGVLLAPLTAAMIAALVLENRALPDLDLVRPDRFGL